VIRSHIDGKQASADVILDESSSGSG